MKLYFYFSLIVILTNVSSACAQGFNLQQMAKNSLEDALCADKLEEAMPFITGTPLIVKDGNKALEILADCINQEDPEILHTVAMMFLGGNKVFPVNLKTGIRLLRKAYDYKHPKATTNLAIAYQMGRGVKLDFNKARRLYEEAYELGSDKAAFKLGYLYYKGLGSITQDYDQAFEWFSKSNYPMAQYFLGLQYYFGYGVAVDQKKAEEVMALSLGSNTQKLYDYLFINDQEKISPRDLNNPIVALDNNAIDLISETATIQIDSSEEAEVKTQIKLLGSWKGKLIELDWSKTKIQRTFPVALEFSKDPSVGSTDYTFTIEQSTSKNFGILFGNEYYFEKLNFDLPRLYKDAYPYTKLNYTLNTALFEQIEINGINYLTAVLDGRINQWKEPAPPMRLILARTNSISENGKEISEELLVALTAVKDDGFITLYPNPFQKDLLIQYEIEQESQVSVLLYNFETQKQQIIEQSAQQSAGEYTYHFDGSHLKSGLYIVKVTTNGMAHTKLVIKK